jgi:hypothetical protein
VSATSIRSVLVYLNRDTVSSGVVAGTVVADDGVTPIPDPPPPAGVNAEISAWIYLSTGQSTITTETGIRDRRDIFGSNNGNIPTPASTGQVFMYIDGNVGWYTPMISEDNAWMVNDDGELIVVG